MISIHKYFKTKAGVYLLSVLLGIGLATIFRKVCQGDMCTVFKAPKPELVVDKIFKFDGKCYKIEKNRFLMTAISFYIKFIDRDIVKFRRISKYNLIMQG